MMAHFDVAPRKPFTGKAMLAIFVAGFGVVIAVNLYMASLATGGFHGVVVDNSYVASQKFNGWLDQAEAARVLGWEADAQRDDGGYVIIRTRGVPQGASLSADLRRPIGTQESVQLIFRQTGPYELRSTEPVDGGRWTIRLHITSGQQVWAEEGELK